MTYRDRFRCFVCRRSYTMPRYPNGIQVDGEQVCHDCSDVDRDEAAADARAHFQSGGVPAWRRDIVVDFAVPGVDVDGRRS